MPSENKQNNTGQTQTSGNQPSHLLSINYMTPKSSPRILEEISNFHMLSIHSENGIKFCWKSSEAGMQTTGGDSKIPT